MSSFKVEVVAVDAVNVHPNADRLELAQVRGWNVVIGKGSFKPGDLAIYFPIDSILSEKLEAKLFSPDSKIKLYKRRIRSIKIRGAVSQGMLVTGEEVGIQRLTCGDDLTAELGVVKYEPPEPSFPVSFGVRTGFKRGNKGQINTNFAKYTDIENIKNYTEVFKEGEPVYISEKLHGTSARYGYVPRDYGSGFFSKIRWLIDRALIGLHLRDPAEFVYGSRNVQLQTGTYRSWYEENVYAKVNLALGFELILQHGECVYGEIVGDGIQKNYSYGCGPGMHDFYAYDVRVDGRWLNFDEFKAFCEDRCIPRVPELWVGPYSKEVELRLREGDSTIGGQKVREGVVIKPLVEEVVLCGRKVLKSISDAFYLDDENTDFH